MKNFKYSKIDEIIKVAKKGKIFILVDDKNRENEGDLVFSAKKTTAKKINFMAKHGRGLICLALDKKQTNKLGLSLMPSRNSSRLKTAFTVSIEARRGVTTGISALDRAKTILVAINQKSNSKSLSTPGHIFPLVARDGGVLTRAGHTEASVDISNLAGMGKSAVICEIMNDDGTMAKGKKLIEYARKHSLKIGKIDDLISYRLKKESFIRQREEKIVIINKKKYKLISFENFLDNRQHLALVYGDIKKNSTPKVRVLSTNSLDIFTNKNVQKDIKNSLKFMSSFKPSVILLIKESDFADLPKIINYTSINDKLSTNIRNYGVGAQILKKLKIKNMILVTRSKKKVIGLEGFGIKIKKQEIINKK